MLLVVTQPALFPLSQKTAISTDRPPPFILVFIILPKVGFGKTNARTKSPPFIKNLFRIVPCRVMVQRESHVLPRKITSDIVSLRSHAMSSRTRNCVTAKNRRHNRRQFRPLGFHSILNLTLIQIDRCRGRCGRKWSTQKLDHFICSNV